MYLFVEGAHTLMRQIATTFAKMIKEFLVFTSERIVSH
jgi:hypothetical protein